VTPGRPRPPGRVTAGRPKPLGVGATLAVVAPSSSFEPEGLEAGLSWLRQRYRVVHAPDILQRQGYFAGDDGRRIRELREALDDPGVDAILAARGGYGATRILPAITPERVRAAAKPIVGFSDITALHALWARAGVGSLHAPMAVALGSASPEERQAFIAALEGQPLSAWTGLSCVVPGRARGRLLGGNLAVLCALLGTPQMPSLEGAVLLLEDVGERPYRVDRMLTSLLQSGSLEGVRALLLGHFTQAAAGVDGVSVEAVLAERLGTLGVPVLSGVPAGHGSPNLSLPLGAEVSVDAGAGKLRFEEG